MSFSKRTSHTAMMPWHSAAICCAAVFSVGALNAAQLANPQPVRLWSYSQLLRLLKKKQPSYLYSGLDAKTGTVISTTPANGIAGGGTGVTPGTTGSGDTQFSVTNVQVAGVDEADIAKTDGQCIYQVNGARVLVIKAYPDNELEVKSVLNLESEFSPYELFLDNGLLVVIGASIRTAPVEKGYFIAPVTAKAVVVDVKDPANCKVVRELEVDGDYLSSRKVDSSVYLVARKYPDFYLYSQTLGGGAVASGKARAVSSRVRRNAGLVPAVTDTALGPKPHRMAPRNVFYFPGFHEPDYLIVAGFDLSDATKPLQVTALLGAGEAVYSSRQHLYVADTQYLPPVGEPVPLQVSWGGVSVANDLPLQSTKLYRFDLDKGAVSFSASGKVPGTVLNQFAMDEYNGYFRVATTTSNWTPNSSNNLYVLDGNMNIEGRLEGLAAGEKIFATRFIGERCYMVTFRMVDPLFVISTADPAAPAVLGLLSIPGFSNYLQPYDENHILGFGKDAVNGLYQGMKIACFDVADVNNPVQLSSVSIGDRGTDSSVLQDHRALLFDKNKGLLAVPITVAAIKNRTPDMPPTTYGETVFQGAYVYNFTLDGGFVFRKAITHQSADQAGTYDWNAAIQRLLYIDTSLYSLSNSQVKVNDLGTLDEKRALPLPQ